MGLAEEHRLDCEILVAGGGLAGVVAALAAARLGATVVLCQDRSVLGGNASSEVRMHVSGADCSGGRGKPLAVEAREGGILEEIRLDNCVRNAQRSPSVFDLLLYEKCRAELGLALLLDTTVTGAVVQGDRITHAVAERQATEDRFTIGAKIFIDCTGDGRLAAEAGAPFREGRESREEFGESLAPPTADRLRLGSSILLQARKHDRPMPFAPPPWARRFTEDDLRLRPHATSGLDLGLEYGFWWAEWGGQLDTIKQGARIRDELLAIVMGVWDHIKNGGSHQAEPWALEWFGAVPAKRESRRMTGQVVLTQDDLIESRRFEDAIGYGGWPIDLHPPGGIDAVEESPCTQHPVPYLYDIPLRACVSRTVANLMFAGRNISATHVAMASTRVMGTCAVIGQGVGTAAAYAARHGCLPAALADDPAAIRAIQQRLLRDDAYLIGVTANDPGDVARRASVTASSQQADCPASNVLSGQTRSVHGEGGVRGDRARPGTHRWASDPATGLPAWIELAWPEPIEARSIQLVFDTGLHRVLTLSQADDFVRRRMLWGRPQPESVRDYVLEGRLGDTWRELARVEGNYQRRRVHRLDGRPLDALRLTVTATNGLDHARVCEVRME